MATFSPPYTTQPAVLPDTKGVARALFRYYDWGVGQTVLKENGVYRTVQYPTQAECEAADAVYLGGHVYTVNSTEAAALIAAGYEIEDI